jgi:hypothetical protein
MLIVAGSQPTFRRCLTSNPHRAQAATATAGSTWGQRIDGASSVDIVARIQLKAASYSPASPRIRLRTRAHIGMSFHCCPLIICRMSRRLSGPHSPQTAGNVLAVAETDHRLISVTA